MALGPVWCWAAVPSAASPSEAPIWRVLSNRPGEILVRAHSGR
ncbi:hypothetical protein [Pseudonocardia adelaidensis]